MSPTGVELLDEIEAELSTTTHAAVTVAKEILTKRIYSARITKAAFPLNLSKIFDADFRIISTTNLRLHLKAVQPIIFRQISLLKFRKK